MIPNSQTMMSPVLEVLKDGVDHANADIRQHLIQQFCITDEEQLIRIPSGTAYQFTNQFGWATTRLKQLGFIISSGRGIYRITPEGQKALLDPPAEILEKEETEPALPGEPVVEENPYVSFLRSYEELRKFLKKELMDNILKHDGNWFEFMVRDLFLKMGYGTDSNIAVTQATRDEGIDIIIKEDRLGLDKIFIQTKRWKETSNIGRTIVQEFAGAINGNGKKGVFVTTSAFTKDAIDYALKNQEHTIVLINGDQLTDLMIEYKLGVFQDSSDYQIFKIDEDYFEDNH